MTTRTWMAMLLASAITAGWVHHAGAQPALAPPGEMAEAGAPSTRRKVEYYGWQILLTDVASAAAGIAVGASDINGGLAVFGTGYALGGPIVHLSNGHPGRALGSLTLRVGLPALVLGLSLLPSDSSCSSNDEYDSCGDDAWGEAVAIIGLSVISMGVASVLDWTVLGLETEEVRVERGPTLVPQVSAGADGSLQIGVLGRF